jgi:hypothetical protein
MVTPEQREKNKARIERTLDVMMCDLISALDEDEVVDDEMLTALREVADVVMRLRFNLLGVPEMCAEPKWRGEMVEELMHMLALLGLDETGNVATKTLRRAGVHVGCWRA